MTKLDSKVMQSLGPMVQMACLWEASARKLGNVHRFADFESLHYLELVASAAVLGPVLDKAWYRPLGEVVLDAIKATRSVVDTNSNLGIVLLLTPLAAVLPGRSLTTDLPRVLRDVTVADATLVYEAIRLAEPGGLGRAPEQDVSDTPTLTLREAMALAENRDRIAWQYTHDFADVLEPGVPTLRKSLEAGQPLESAIRRTHLAFLAAFEDSLILRKRGPAVAGEVRRRAEALLTREAPEESLAAFDTWLRAERLNPGTSADLVAASLFAALREGIMTLPWKGPWS